MVNFELTKLCSVLDQSISAYFSSHNWNFWILRGCGFQSFAWCYPWSDYFNSQRDIFLLVTSKWINNSELDLSSRGRRWTADSEYSWRIRFYFFTIMYPTKLSHIKILRKINKNLKDHFWALVILGVLSFMLSLALLFSHL